MFGYTLIQTSELKALQLKKDNLLNQIDVMQRRHLAVEQSLRREVGNCKIQIIELEEALVKYKTLYLEELEKRLEMAKSFSEREEES